MFLVALGEILEDYNMELLERVGLAYIHKVQALPLLLQDLAHPADCGLI